MFGLFQGFYSAKCHAVPVRLDHYSLTNVQLKVKNPYQSPDHMLHGIMIVIMKQYLVQGKVKRGLDIHCFRLCVQKCY